MKKQLKIADESFDAVIDELTREVGKILKPPDNQEEADAFVSFYGTLTTMATKRFNYWPEEDTKDLLSFCGTWMHVGILLGKSPKLLADILKRTNARTVEADKG